MRPADFDDESDRPGDQPNRPRPRSRRRRFDDDPEPTRKGRLTKEERVRLAKRRDDAYADSALPGDADRWSTWDEGERGPLPYPSWVVTELAAVDTELGVLKTGKEADVDLLHRGLPDGTPGCLLAAKRYRDDGHRLFHRDSGYLEGRRLRRTREMRAMRTRSTFGRNLIAEQWAISEFATLSTLYSAGAPVPYPVQRNGTELLLEFIGDSHGVAAPRLAQLRADERQLRSLWCQVESALEVLASLGLTHGDLSAFNIMVHNGQIVLIDLPQVVDLVANPQGADYLARDVHNITTWFAGHGLGTDIVDADRLRNVLTRLGGISSGRPPDETR